MFDNQATIAAVEWDRIESCADYEEPLESDELAQYSYASQRRMAHHIAALQRYEQDYEEGGLYGN